MRLLSKVSGLSVEHTRMASSNVRTRWSGNPFRWFDLCDSNCNDSELNHVLTKDQTLMPHRVQSAELDPAILPNTPTRYLLFRFRALPNLVFSCSTGNQVAEACVHCCFFPNRRPFNQVVQNIREKRQRVSELEHSSGSCSLELESFLGPSKELAHPASHT